MSDTSNAGLSAPAGDSTSTEIHALMTTRHFELDRGGALPPATLLRYFESVRWQAARNVETSVGVVFKERTRMVVRAQSLEVLESVGGDVDLRVGLWIERVGNTSLEMGQDAVRIDTGATVARASVVGVQTDWSGRPMPFPDALRGLARPRGHRLARPVGPAPAAPAWFWDYSVRLSDLDLLQHMNQANYGELSEDTRAFAAAAGAYGDVDATGALSRLTVEYIQEAKLGERLRFTTWVIEDAEGPAFGIEGRRGGEEKPVCRARIEAVRTR